MLTLRQSHAVLSELVLYFSCRMFLQCLHVADLTARFLVLLQERVVQVSRVTKVVKGGKSMSFR